MKRPNKKFRLLQTYIELYIRAYRYIAHAHLKTWPFSDVLCFCYHADLMKSTKVTYYIKKVRLNILFVRNLDHKAYQRTKSKHAIIMA